MCLKVLTVMAPKQPDQEAKQRLEQLANEMGPDGVDQNHPTRTVMGMLGDRWSPLILLVLETGDWRHADLRRIVSELASEPEISQRVLTLKLRALERDGFVKRDVSNDIPPKVTYSLTTLGRVLVAQLRAMILWLNEQEEEIMAARARYDKD